MTGAASLRELGARVEAADQPNIHLDIELWVRLGSAERRDREWSDRLPTDPDARCNGLKMGEAIAAGWPAADIRTAWKVPALTANLDAAVALVERRLPGFWQSSGLCSLTGHASIGPDYNGPDAERLHREWPEERFHEGFHADLKPGDGRHRQCLALIHCAIQGLAASIENDLSAGA